jgi:CRISPR-associated exonuclease Cas4
MVSMTSPLVLLALLVAALCIVTVVRRARHGAAPRSLIYTDADGRGRSLHSPLRPLSGKPDYVIRTRRGDLVPVELKSYRGGARPPHADVIQLGAYLLLLEDVHGRRPRHGILRYPDRSLRVPYTEALRAEVLGLLEHIQHGGSAPPPGAPHPAVCRACPFAPMCDVART